MELEESMHACWFAKPGCQTQVVIEFLTPKTRRNALRQRLFKLRKEAVMFTGVKVFSATKAKEREELGETVTRWMRANADVEIVDKVVRQSSDNEFHCYSLVLFYREKKKG
jgi:hypothetical protein